MVRRMLHLSLSILISLFLFGCGGQKINSFRINSTINIDGNGEDWEKIPVEYHEDMKIILGMANDANMLYMMFRFNDNLLARKLSSRGLTVWFNGNNKKEKNFGIHYINESSRFPALGFPSQKNGNFSAEKIPPNGKFTLAQNDSSTDIEISEIEELDAAFDLMDGLYCCEVSIPFKASPDDEYSLDFSNSEVIKVGIEIGGLSEEEQAKIKEEMSNRRGSGKRGGGGRGGGGMVGQGPGGKMGGGRGGRGMPDGGMHGGPDMDGEVVWITVNLAQESHNKNVLAH